MNKLTIVSIGSGDSRDLTVRAEAALRSAPLLMRTARHPITPWLKAEGIAFDSLDELYEQSEDFDAFNQKAAALIRLQCEEKPFCYAVSDALFDSTVAAVRAAFPENAEIETVPGVSHVSRCMALVHEIPAGLRVFAAEDFLKARAVPTEALLLTELHSAVCAGECKLRLMDLLPEELSVRLISGDEQSGELHAATVPLYELDRQEKYDHLSAAYIPAVPYLERDRHDADDLREVMRRLRAPDGCPWDKEQTHETLLESLLEESWEFIQAVHDGDTDHMYDELGDVLLQVYFHAEIARQHGTFAINDVTTAICRKMIERHPHIFGTAKAETADDVLVSWEAIKRKQRGLDTTSAAMRNVSLGLSPLLRAKKIQHKARKVGFDFADAKEALGKVTEEAREVLENLESGADPEMELGDLLFSVVNVCRLCEKEPDLALQKSTEKFLRRFEIMENLIKNDGKSIKDLTLSEMNVYWEHGKCSEQSVSRPTFP